METITEESRCYLVRTEREFVNKDIVAIGWSWVDFTQHTNANEIISVIGQHIGRWGNQIRRFVGMKQGDVVVVPLYKSVAIGIATDEMFYSAENKPNDRSNQRGVKFLKDGKGKPLLIPRTLFDGAFQSRLKNRITVSNITEFKAQLEEHIRDLNLGKILSSNEKANEKIKKLEDDFKQTLLKNIRNGKTRLQAGGVGLENLVKELLHIHGYEADVLSKRAFSSFADADVIASKSDGFVETKLLVQVKHHHGVASKWGIQQLEEIKNQDKGDYSDYQLMLITSAAVSENLRIYADERDISIIDGDELVNLIFDSINKLSDETKIKLGICEVPQIAIFS